MSSQLYTYSMIRALYDKGEDYIDSFWPFVLCVLPPDKSALSYDAIQGIIEKKYGLDIPQHSLGVIVTRAKHKNLISAKNRRCALTENGLKYLQTFEPEKDVNRRINELLEDARGFLKEKHHVTLSSTDIRELIQAFVKEHIEFFEQFINPEGVTAELSTQEKILQAHEAALLSYLAGVERAKPSIFNTLQEIVCGSIISAILRGKSLAEATKRFEHTSVYFDTSFAFSTLALDFDAYNKPAQELLKLMNLERSFRFKVFDFTVDEMVRVLRNYPKEHHLYLPNIKVGSIFSSLKAKGWTTADITEFIVKIEENLWKLGITVEPTRVDLQKYTPTSENQRDALLKYKPEQRELGQNHDLAAVEKIVEIRKGPV